MKGESVVGKKKLAILGSAKDVGIKKTVGLGAVHFLTVYQWQIT
jgi:hypothetical protein